MYIRQCGESHCLIIGDPGLFTCTTVQILTQKALLGATPRAPAHAKSRIVFDEASFSYARTCVG